jgi:hypothetical protein
MGAALKATDVCVWPTLQLNVIIEVNIRQIGKTKHGGTARSGQHHIIVSAINRTKVHPTRKS